MNPPEILCDLAKINATMSIFELCLPELSRELIISAVIIVSLAQKLIISNPKTSQRTVVYGCGKSPAASKWPTIENGGASGGEPEQSAHLAGQVGDSLSTSPQWRVSSIAHVFAAPVEK